MKVSKDEEKICEFWVERLRRKRGVILHQINANISCCQMLLGWSTLSLKYPSTLSRIHVNNNCQIFCDKIWKISILWKGIFMRRKSQLWWKITDHFGNIGFNFILYFFCKDETFFLGNSHQEFLQRMFPKNKKRLEKQCKECHSVTPFFITSKCTTDIN